MALWILGGGESMDEMAGFCDLFNTSWFEANSGVRSAYGFNNASVAQMAAPLKGNRTRVWSKLWIGRNNQLGTGKFFQSYYDGANERLRFDLVYVAGIGTCIRCSTVNGASVATLFTCTLPHFLQTAASSTAATTLGNIHIDVNYIAAGWVRVYRDTTLAGEFIGDPRIGGSTFLTECRFQSPNTAGSWAEAALSQIILGDEDTRELRIITHFPNAAGDANTFSSAAFGNIDEVGDQGTDFNESLVAAQKFLAQMSNVPAAFGTPNVRTLSVRSRAMGSAALSGGPTQYRQLIKTAGIEFQGAVKAPASAAYSVDVDDFDVNPNTGLVWTKAEIDALQLGHLSVA
jgi:hypothetical protein